MSTSYYDSNQQSTACLGSSEYEYRYIPTESNSQIFTIAVPPQLFGEQISRNSVNIVSDDKGLYNIVDDGNGNLINTTGSIQYSNVAYGTYGVRLYTSSYNLDGTGNYIAWNTPINGGTYTGSYWANPNYSITASRMNQTALSTRDTASYADISLNFNITASSNTTYYFGLGEDNYSSIYLDNTTIIDQSLSDTSGVFQFWNIYPVAISSGSHSVSIITKNTPSYLKDNPIALALEIYNNTYTQISQSITAGPTGSNTPANLNIVYSSKDHVGDLKVKERVGNVIYSQGLIIITNNNYVDAFNDLEPIKIGSQYWSSKNLNVSKYRNGDIIPEVNDSTQWANLTTGAWCYYGDNSGNPNIASGSVYGKLYNWYAVNDSRGLAPQGWHVPSDGEWTTLTNYLGGDAIAGGKMKESGTTHWASPNTGATNSSGFAGLPGGYRDPYGTFYDIGNLGFWWSSSAYNTSFAWFRDLSCSSANVGRYFNNKTIGFSVRLIKD